MFGAQLGAIVGSLAVVKAVASLVTVSEFGRFALILAVAAVISTLLLGPLTGSAARHYQEARESDALRAYYSAVLRVFVGATGVGILLAGGVVLLCPGIVRESNLTSGMIAAGIALGVAMAYAELLVALTNAALRRRLGAVFVMAGSWGRVAGIAVAYGLGARTAIGFACGMLAAVAVVLGAQLATLVYLDISRGGMDRGRSPFRGTLVAYALPLIAWGIPGYALAFGDRFLLSYFTDPTTVGIYAAMAAASLGVTGALGSATNRALEPALYAESGAGIDADRNRGALRLLHRATLLMALVSIPLLGAYALWPGRIIALFTSGAYAGEASLLVVMFAAGSVFTISQQLMLHGLVIKKPWSYVPAKLLHAGLFVTGIMIAVPQYGVAGLIWAVFAANIVQLVLVVLVNRYRLPVAANVANSGYRDKRTQ